MPARTIPFVTEEYYHLFNRGVNKQPIFLEAKEYNRAINSLRYYRYTETPMRYSHFATLSSNDRKQIWEKLKAGDSRRIDIIAYCLMPNHYHLLVKQCVGGGIDHFMGDWQKSLAKYHNTRYGRIGPVFQGRFRAVRIESDEQLLHLSRYIHLNPYSSYVVKRLDQLAHYKWSPLREFIMAGKEVCNPLTVLDHFSNRSAYRQFVFDYGGYQRTLRDIRHLLIETP